MRRTYSITIEAACFQGFRTDGNLVTGCAIMWRCRSDWGGQVLCLRWRVNDGVKLAGVTAVFVAGNNSFAVKTDGTFWIWGAGGRNEWPLEANTKLPVKLDLP